MSKQTEAISNDVSQLAEDARELMSATADMVGERVDAARKRLSTALDAGKSMCEHAGENAVAGAKAGAKATNEAIHEHPYKAIVTGIGLGAVLGFLIARRCPCS